MYIYIYIYINVCLCVRACAARIVFYFLQWPCHGLLGVLRQRAQQLRKNQSRRGAVREKQLLREQRGGGQLSGELPGEPRKGLRAGGLPRKLLRSVASLQRPNQQSRRRSIHASLQRQHIASLQRQHIERRDWRGTFLLPMWICSSGVLQRMTVSIAHGTKPTDKEPSGIAFVA